MNGRNVTAKINVKVKVKIIQIIPDKTNNYDKNLISCVFNLFFICTESHFLNCIIDNVDTMWSI